MDPSVSGKDGDVRLAVRAQPGAKRSAVVGRHGDRLKIAVQAPPVDGKANEALCGFIANWLDVPRRAVTLGAGDTSRDKRVDIATDLSRVLTKVADVP
jgi:hypothetical protein